MSEEKYFELNNPETGDTQRLPHVEGTMGPPGVDVRKLFPNVDFYSSIIYKAMGIPKNMFTAMFAIARTVGWVSNWCEMQSDPSLRIGRPRQNYTGYQPRDYVPIDQRD